MVATSENPRIAKVRDGKFSHDFIALGYGVFEKDLDDVEDGIPSLLTLRVTLYECPARRPQIDMIGCAWIDDR